MVLLEICTAPFKVGDVAVGGNVTAALMVLVDICTVPFEMRPVEVGRAVTAPLHDDGSALCSRLSPVSWPIVSFARTFPDIELLLGSFPVACTSMSPLVNKPAF